MIQSSQCGERSGFLFKHRCDRMASNECQLCGKKICDYHTESTVSNEEIAGQSSTLSIACTTCAKRRSRILGGGYASPYYYGDSNYHGWGRGPYSSGSSGSPPVADDFSGPPPLPAMASAEALSYDPNDLTEADGGATEVLGDEGFETDMEGS